MGDSGRFSSLCAGAPWANRRLAGATGWHPGAESILPREPPIQPWPDSPRRVAGASVAQRCPRGSWSPALQRGLDNQEGKCGLCSLEGGSTMPCRLQPLGCVCSYVLWGQPSLLPFWSGESSPGAPSPAWSSLPVLPGPVGRGTGLSLLMGSACSCLLDVPMVTNQLFPGLGSLRIYQSRLHTMSSLLLQVGDLWIWQDGEEKWIFLNNIGQKPACTPNSVIVGSALPLTFPRAPQNVFF